MIQEMGDEEALVAWENLWEQQKYGGREGIRH